MDQLDLDTIQTGTEIFNFSKSRTPTPLDRSYWTQKLMSISMSDENLKLQLFRFVDVLPSIKTKEQLANHINEYFGEYSGEFKSLILSLTKISTSTTLTQEISKILVQFGVNEMAKTFIAGSTLPTILSSLNELHAKRQFYTVDILGEAVLSEKEAGDYSEQYLNLIDSLYAHSKKLKIDSSDVNISIKLSSLFSQAESVSFSFSKDRLISALYPIVKSAIEKNIFINIDMEDYHFKDLTIAVFKEIFSKKEFKAYPNVGIVIQAYLRSSENDLGELISWTKMRGTPIAIRLVKGAYWDYEKINSNKK